MKSKVAVTGATGFIGRALCSSLSKNGFSGFASCRSEDLVRSVDRFDFVRVGEINAQTNWLTALVEVECVIHCAARAHIMNDSAVDRLAIYRKVNVEGTRRLAEQAADSGVSRFVYLSSIKVNGEQTQIGDSFRSSDNARPEDSYGISKWEAEQALHKVSNQTGLEVVIIRPPLVYGPGVKGNFLHLLKLLNSNLPLPLGAIHNQRSLVEIDNLISLIITCINHPDAANQTFMVSDGEDLSTTDLLRRLSTALDKSVRLLPIPAILLQFGGNLLGKRVAIQKLLHNLQVDISNTKEVLGWSPTVRVDVGLQKTADWYLGQI